MKQNSVNIKWKDFLLIPNILSCLRILLIPVFILLYLNGLKGAAIIVLIISGLSDMIDGIIARHFNMISELGKLLDPVADKLNQAGIVFCLAIKFSQVRVLLVLFLIKEFCMIVGGLILLHSGQKPIPAKWWGKLSTAVFYIVMTIILIFGDYTIKFKLPNIMITILTAISAICLIFSFVNYIPIFYRIKIKN